MVISLSAAVMAHPSRADLVEDLLGRLDQPVPVVWDQVNDRHDTGVRALAAFDPAATHHLVLQDDVLPCRDLLASITAALAHVPEGHPASFYLGRVKPFRRAVERAVSVADGSVSWLTFQGPMWGPAIVVPTAEIPGLVDWWSTPRARRVQNYDRRVATWFDRRHCWYSWPSLVDHRGDQSLVTGHTAIRTAHRVVPAEASGLEVDWSGTVLPLRRAHELDRQRQAAARRAGVGR
jgi:hypothetical protein